MWHLQALLSSGLSGATINTNAQEDKEQLLVRAARELALTPLCVTESTVYIAQSEFELANADVCNWVEVSDSSNIAATLGKMV